MTATTLAPAAEVSGRPPYPTSAAAYRYALFVVVLCLVLIQFGGMVTSTSSGMAYLTWPHSAGYWLWPPDMDLPKFFEHSHRLVAAGVGLSIIGLVVQTWRADSRRWMRWFAVGLLVLILVQGAIGGIGVLMNLPLVTSVAHGTLAQVFLCLLTVPAFALSRAWNERFEVSPSRQQVARRLGVVTLVSIFAQLVLGAVLRHSNSSYAKWIHVSFALFVAMMVLVLAAWCAGRLRHVPGVRRNVTWILVVLLTQVILGFLTLALRIPKYESNVEFLGRAALQTSHVFFGAVLFLLTTVLVLRCFRGLVVGSKGTGS